MITKICNVYFIINIDTSDHRRPGGGGGGPGQGQGGVLGQLPPNVRNQVNQAVGQAVTGAMMNELGNAFARFK